MGLNLNEHPCFDAAARERFGRVHLPVAPKCNVQCNFCNRKHDCLNEGRPGVTSSLLTPRQAREYVRRLVARRSEIRVVGIAGPGDPFANPDETLMTLRLVREDFPEMLLCLASNGLNVAPYADEIAELEVSHVTITVNAVDPEVGQHVYRWVRPGPRVYRGREGAELLLERQLASINALKERGVTVKINTIVIPGINDHHVAEVARIASGLGCDLMNTMALYAVPGTPFGTLEPLTHEAMLEHRRRHASYLPQMEHCTRCRADAVGFLGESPDLALLQEVAAGASRPGGDRPYVAVASQEGILVNQHLGDARQLWIYRQEGDAFELVERRPTPPAGSGPERWQALGELLSDCSVVVTSGAGNKPRKTLDDAGLSVLVADTLVDEALGSVFSGKPLRAPSRETQCGTGCSGSGGGCG